MLQVRACHRLPSLRLSFTVQPFFSAPGSVFPSLDGLRRQILVAQTFRRFRGGVRPVTLPRR